MMPAELQPADENLLALDRAMLRPRGMLTTKVVSPTRTPALIEAPR